MPLVRKRRARDPESEPESSAGEAEDPQPQRRRRHEDTPPDDIYPDDEDATENDASNIEPLARKLCRYALSCEYARQPIRRADVSAKVLPPNEGRLFKQVFPVAQDMLRSVFGMEMLELPGREKVTLQQRKKAARQEADKKQSQQGQATNAWVLVSTLPEKYKGPGVVGPPAVPTQEQEAAYVGLYTFLVSIIYLAGGSVPESKIERYLRRMNADRNTPVGATDALFKRLVREGYIVRVVDWSDASEDAVEYVVGPRGKVEVGEEGVGGLVRSVWGGESGTGDLEKRLQNSLGIGGVREREEKEKEKERKTADAATQRRSGRRRRDEEEEEDEDEDDEE